MKAAQRKQFLKLLETLQQDILGKGLAEIAPNRTSAEETGQDEDEQPLNEMIQSIASDRNRNQERVLLLVNKALNKLREEPDEFGLCEECGEDIVEGRLKAMPYAEYCVACQGSKDGPKGRPTRRNLTDYS